MEPEKVVANFSYVFEQLYPDTAARSVQNDEYLNVLSNQGGLLRSEGKIFVYGKKLRPQISSVNEAHFNHTIHENLYKHKYRSLFSIQSVCWNEIVNKRSIMIVNTQNSGKTITILPPLLSCLLDQMDEENTLQGPTAIIITRTSREVEILYQLCFQLAPKLKKQVIAAFGIWKFKKNCIDLLNGCDLLITTPSCFRRFSETDTIKMFDRKRIKYLAFENLDLMHEKFKDDIENVFRVCTYGTKSLNENPQIIITATCWQNYLHEYMKTMIEPIVVIGSNIEAALFVKSRFTVSKSTLTEKNKKIIEYLQKYEWRKKKTAIIFNDRNEINEFQALLRNKAIGYVMLEQDTQIYEIESWIREKKFTMNLLLVHDDILVEKSIGCVQIAIHYSLPSTWSAFSRRFSLSLNYYKSYCEMIEKTEEYEPWTVIFMDENNLLQMPKILRFLTDRRLVKQIPTHVQNEAEKIKNNIEQAQISDKNRTLLPLCTHILKFASCSAYKCANRHVFVSEDQPTYIPSSGRIKFTIVGINSPLHFAVTLTDYLPKSGQKWISFKENLETTCKGLAEFQEYMSNEENQWIDGEIKIGNLYAFFHIKTLVWRRCKLIRICKNDEESMETIVEIHFIDFGGKIKVNTKLLMKLNDNLKLLVPLVCDVRIINMVPYDLDELFDYETIDAVKSFINRTITKKDFIICDVDMAVGDTIITRNIYVFEKLKNLKSDILKLSYKKFLLDNRFALNKGDVLESLMKLATESSFEINTHQEATDGNALITIGEKTKVEELNWKNANLSIGKIYHAKLLNLKSPENFFIQIKSEDHDEMLTKLKQIEKYECNQKLEQVSRDTVCLVKSEDGKSFRCVITQIEPLKVFLVDYGTEMITEALKLYKIPAKQPFTMHFQAVKCALKDYTTKNISKLKECLQYRKYFNDLSKKGAFQVEVHSKNKTSYLVSVHGSDTDRDDNEFEQVSKIKDTDHVELQIQEAAMNDLLNQLKNDENIELEQKDFNLIYGLPDSARILLNTTDDQKEMEVYIDKSKENQKLTSNNRNLQNNNAVEINKVAIKNIYSKTTGEWTQNEKIIMMKIDAINLIDYSLRISATCAELIIKFPNRTSFSKIDFYGQIYPEYVCHKSNGMHITIFLIKKFCDVLWPRLTLLKESNANIKYSCNELAMSCWETNAVEPSVGFPTGEFYSNVEAEFKEYDDALDQGEIM